MFWRLNDLGGGRPNQLSPHPQAYNLTQRKIQALSMAEWSLFRSEINQMRSSLTAIERTSGSIVMAAVETEYFYTPQGPTGAGFKFCNGSSSLDRRQPVADAGVPKIGHLPCLNR